MPPNKKASTDNLNRARGGVPSTGVPGWSQSQNQNARQIMAILQIEGATKAGAAGVVGNWMQESSLNAEEPGGYLAQWLGGRFSALVTFARAIGKAPTSVEAQSRFAAHELKTGYPNLWKFLTTTNDPAAAAVRVSREYERPASTASDPTRAHYAQQVFGVVGSGFGVQGASQGAGPDTGGAASQPGAFGSVLDLLNSPVDAIGGWLAQIALNVVKDTAVGIFDAIIVPFWHWNQRAVDTYTTDMFSDKSGIPVVWNAAFWGLGYFLLFTDPDSGNLKPAPVRRSRMAKHTRLAQSVPARLDLVKPGKVKERTPRKPTPTNSTAPIRALGTMSTYRPERVKVNVSGRNDRGRSTVPIERAGTREEHSRERKARGSERASAKSDAKLGAGDRSLQDRGRHPQGSPGPRRSTRR